MERAIVHLITGLSKGGAETMLYQILKYRQNPELNYKVINLGGAHYYEGPMRELGYEVIELDFRRRPLSGFVRLCREIWGADTLCCWMYHANFAGYLAGRMSGVKRIVWGIRNSDLLPAHNEERTLRINLVCARWSKNVSLILYNGNRAREVHEALGYCHEKGLVVDNGCDCDEYRPDETAARSLRDELGIPDEKVIVLSLTKAVPMKDIPTFLKAFGVLHKQNGSLTAVLCGPDVEGENEMVAALCRDAELVIGKDVFLLGMRHDVPRLLAACDLNVMHSAGEAFPNKLLQAMACGCVCVTTDVGDSRRILNNDDCVVPTGDADALAEKMAELLALPEDQAEAMRRKNRERALTEFDIREIIKTYEAKF